MEHPLEVARQALRDAADMEGDEDMARMLREAARALPWRTLQPTTSYVEEGDYRKWRDLPPVEREHRILNALLEADTGLTVSELEQAIGLRDMSLRPMLANMASAGMIRRVSETMIPGGCKHRWRFFQKIPDAAEIAKLEAMMEG